jgi:O-antigen/teichoic acid export membrane protein
VFENMQAVVPQAVGRGRYHRLWINYLRVVVLLAVASLAFYAVVIVVAPLLLVPIFGPEWLPVLPLLPALAIFGMTTTVGGVFGPLYRALNLMRSALIIKIGTLFVLPAGVWMINQWGAVGGAWAINALFLVSVAATIVVTLWVLYQRAQGPEAVPGASNRES